MSHTVRASALEIRDPIAGQRRFARTSGAIRRMTPMINLASQPFRRERAQNAGLASVCVLLACALVVLVSLIFHSRAQAADLRRDIKTQNAELQNLQRQEAQFLAVVSKPQNADVFATSNFLNELIARRAVSWTRVFKDL